jgi:protein SCO1/2
MLRHEARHYQGLSTAEAERLRGEILAAFEDRIIPAAALAIIQEELRTSSSPVVLAGAARALRGSQALDGEMRELLRAAGERIGPRDEYVRFSGEEREGCRLSPALTARQEIGATIGPSASASVRSCCADPGAAAREAGALPEAVSLCSGALAQVRMEDQSGASSSLVDLLRGRTSLLAAFYTRCMNPAKCSLTITRLAAFARFAHSKPRGPELNIFALSYDGAYDRPDRLFAYGRDRDFPFSEQARMIRCRSGWDALRRQLELRVGYGQATVNDHARELFLVLPGLEVVALDVEWLADREGLMTRISEALSAVRLAETASSPLRGIRNDSASED